MWLLRVAAFGAALAQPAFASTIRVLLHDPDSSKRWVAARQLAADGDLAHQAVTALVTALRTDLDYGVREACAVALGGTHKPVPDVLSALYDAATLSRDAPGHYEFWDKRNNQRYYFHVRQAAALALTRLGNDGVLRAIAILDAEEGHVEAAEVLMALSQPEVEAALRRYRERRGGPGDDSNRMLGVHGQTVRPAPPSENL